jgi:outer membrane biosynthesis protein TonB
VEVERPAGDAFLDQNVEAIAMRLRFHLASADGEPFDVRFRFNLTFTCADGAARLTEGAAGG